MQIHLSTMGIKQTRGEWTECTNPLPVLTLSPWGQHYGYHNSARQVLHLHSGLSCTLPVTFRPFLCAFPRHFYGRVRRDLFVAAQLFNNVGHRGMHPEHRTSNNGTGLPPFRPGQSSFASAWIMSLGNI